MTTDWAITGSVVALVVNVAWALHLLAQAIQTHVEWRRSK